MSLPAPAQGRGSCTAAACAERNFGGDGANAVQHRVPHAAPIAGLSRRRRTAGRTASVCRLRCGPPLGGAGGGRFCSRSARFAAGEGEGREAGGAKRLLAALHADLDDVGRPPAERAHELVGIASRPPVVDAVCVIAMPAMEPATEIPLDLRVQAHAAKVRLAADLGVGLQGGGRAHPLEVVPTVSRRPLAGGCRRAAP